MNFKLYSKCNKILLTNNKYLAILEKYWKKYMSLSYETDLSKSRSPNIKIVSLKCFISNFCSLSVCRPAITANVPMYVQQPVLIRKRLSTVTERYSEDKHFHPNTSPAVEHTCC